MPEAGRPTGIAPLSVRTDLRVSVDGTEADVGSTGDRLFVEFRSVPEAIRALRSGGGATADRLHAALTVTDLTLEARVRGRTVAVVGAGAEPGIASRLLSIEPIEVRPAGILGAAGAEVAAALETVSPGR